MLDVQLGRFRRVVRHVVQVTLCRVSVVGRQLVVAGFVVLCGFAMMVGGMFVVFGCFAMMLCGLCGHVSSFRFGPNVGPIGTA